jgi:hypothetical protein
MQGKDFETFIQPASADPATADKIAVIETALVGLFRLALISSDDPETAFTMIANGFGGASSMVAGTVATLAMHSGQSEADVWKHFDASLALCDTVRKMHEAEARQRVKGLLAQGMETSGNA